MTEVSRIEVFAELNDADLLAGLRSAEAAVDRTTKKLAATKAQVNIDADLTEFEDKAKEARRELKRLEGLKAKPKIDGDAKKLDEEILQAKKRVKELDGEVARVQLEVKGQEKAVAAIAAVKAAEESLKDAEAKREAAYEKAETKRQALIQSEGRMQAAALAEDEKRARTEAKASESRQAAIQAEGRMQAAAYREDDRLARAAEEAALKRVKDERQAQFDSTVGVQRQKMQVAQLEKEYSKLTDAIERVSKRRAFTTEGRAKVDVDTRFLRAKFEAVKAELNFLGGHPPAKIQVELDRRASMGRIRRQFATLGDTIKGIAEKASNLSDLTLRLGPFTTSIKGFATALAFLGPTVTDLIGSLGALVGVAGAGIMGAFAVGSGALVGFGAGLGGIMLSLNTAKADFKIATQATAAYTKAVDKYGEHSKQAKKAQDQMNSVLKHVSPLAKEAALGASKFQAGWDKATKSTQKSFGNIAKNGFSALNDMRGMWADSTNQLSNTLDHSLKGGFKFLKSPEFRNDFKQITGNFNSMVPSVMHGLGSLGRGFLNFAREGSKFLKPMGEGFDKFANKMLAFTQRDSFGDTVKKWVGYAHDLISLFGAAARVMVHFFGAGEKAGDGLVKSMTGALNRWDDFLKSDSGKEQMADAFDRAAKGAKALWHALAPLAGAFLTWSSMLSPFVTGLLKGFGWTMKLVGGLTKLLGLGGPFAALGATIGAVFAVSKIGGFIEGLFRVVAAMKEIRSLSAGWAVLSNLKGIFGGKLQMGAGGIATAMEAGGTSAAAEIGGAMEAAGAAAAAEIGGAMRAGGAVSGAENFAGDALGNMSPGGVHLPRGAAADIEKAAESTAKFGGASVAAEAGATGLAGALGGLGVAGGLAATGGLAILTGAAIALSIKLLSGKSASQKLSDTLKQVQATTQDYANTSHGLIDAQGALGASTRSYRKDAQTTATLERQLIALRNKGKSGTQAYRDKLDQFNAAYQQSNADEKVKLADSAKVITLTAKQIGLSVKMNTAQQAYNTALSERSRAQKQLDSDIKNGVTGDDLVGDRKKLTDAEDGVTAATKRRDAAVRAERQAELDAIGASMNYQRTLANLPPLTERAATSLAKLAKTAGGKALSKTINLKFTNPKDAGNVAASAAKTLSSGVPKSVTTKIVADSRSATEAVQKLQAVRLQPKTLKITDDGGSITLKKLQNIVGVKLAAKIQKITASDDGATTKVKKLIALGIPAKTARLLAHDGATAIIEKVKKNNPHDKPFTVVAHDNASGILGRILGLIDSLHDKTVTLTTVQKTTGTGGLPGHGAASGRMPGVSETAWVGEGHNWKGARELIADHKTGSIQQVSSPTLMRLSPTQAVIPTEPRHAAKGKSLWAAFAKRFGMDPTEVPSFAKGKKAKKNPPASNKAKAGARKQARSLISKKAKLHDYSSDNLVELKNVEKAKRDENNFREVVQREAGILDASEPSTFIMETGQVDPETGDPIYAVNEPEIAKWSAKLNAMAARFDELTKKVNATLTAVTAAIKRIGDPYAGKPDTKSVIGRAQHNIATLQDAIDHEQGTVSNSKSKAAIDKARERIKVYKAAQSDERAVVSAATSDWKLLDDERNDIGDTTRGRISESTDTANIYRADSAAVAGKAAAEATSANPKPQKPDTASAATTPDSPEITPDAQAQIDQANTKAAAATFNSNVLGAAVQAFGSPGDIGAGIFANAYNAGAGIVTSALSSGAGAAVGSSRSASSSMSDTSSRPGASRSASGVSYTPGVTADLTGSGSGSGGDSGGTTININTLHPGDSRTLSAIASAATAGFDQQNPVTASRVRLGL